MNREEKLLDQRAEKALGKELSIPTATEDKIQAAYDIVRAKNRQKIKEGKMKHTKTSSFRHVWAAGLAAALLAVSGLGVLAATGYFTKTVNEGDNKISYEFEVNYELKPVEVQATPSYIPEGMEDQGDGKFWSQENYGHGISILPLNMVNIDENMARMNFDHVANVEKTTIQNMETHIITFEDEEKYQTGKDIYMFNPEEGYVVWVYGDYNVPLEEVKKVAENLEITVKENEDLKYNNTAEDQLEKEKQAADDAQWDALVEKGVTADQITKIGDALECFDGRKYTVEEVNLYDSLYDVPGYTEKGVYSMERLTSWLNEDGTHKSYLRTHYDENGNILDEEEASVKFLAVKATAEQFGEPEGVWTDAALDGFLVFIEKRADGTYNFKKDSYDAVPSENYDLQMDQRCFYLDQPVNLQGEERDHSFFYRTMEKGERITYTLIFAIDKDRIPNDDLSQVVLQFNGTGNDCTNPMWSALGEIK